MLVLSPVKVREPDPTFVNAPVPSNTPENSVSEPSLPADKVWLEAMLIVPAPAIDPTVSVASKSYVAPLATVIAVLSDNVPVAFKVPALIVVAPEYVFAPVKVNVPVPALVRVALVPDIAATSELVPVMVIETAALFCKAIVDVSISAAETVKPLIAVLLPIVSEKVTCPPVSVVVDKV